MDPKRIGRLGVEEKNLVRFGQCWNKRWCLASRAIEAPYRAGIAWLNEKLLPSQQEFCSLDWFSQLTG